MAKKKFTDVYVAEGIAQGTNGNDVFHVTTTDVNTVVRTSITTKKINSKGKVVTTTTTTKGSDVLYIEGLKTTDVDALTMKQQVDEGGNKTRNLEITTNDGRTIIVENYFKDTTGKAASSSIKSIRAEYPEGDGWHSSLTDPQCKDVLITDLGAIDYDGTFTPKKNKVTGTSFNDTIDMSENTKKLTINGGLGNDVITGGKNNDTIVGGKGANVLLYTEGSGNDTVKLTSGERLVIKYITEAEEPKFDIKESGKNVVISRTYTDNEGNTKTDNITVANLGNNNLAESVILEYGADADNTTHVYDLVNDVYLIEGKKTKITGTNLNETIYGTTLNDTIKGGGGNDTIRGDVGNDTLYGGAGIDTFVFGTYEFNGKFYGSGKDSICDIQEGEILEFQNSNIEDIKFAQSKKNLVITYFDKDSKDSTVENVVTVKNYYKKSPDIIIKARDAQGNLAEFSSAELLAGAVDLDAIAEERAEIGDPTNREKINSYGNLVNQVSDLTGENEELQTQNEDLQGQNEDLQTQNEDLQTQNEILINNQVNVINGTFDNDTFTGTDNKDVFVVQGGIDTIETSENDDTLLIPEGAVEYVRNFGEEDLIIKYGEGNQVTLTGYFSSDGHSVKTVKQGENEFNLETEVAAKLRTYISSVETDTVGTTGHDRITLSSLPAEINPLGGNDDIYQQSDYPLVINFSSGGGQDTVYAGGSSYADGSDTILNFTDVDFSQLSFSRSAFGNLGNYGLNLVIRYGSNSSDCVVLRDWFWLSETSGKINTIKDKNGNLYSISDIPEIDQLINNYSGTNGDDIFYVKGNGETITGLKGHDWIILYNGNEHIFNFSVGDGNDLIEAAGYYYADGTNTTLNFIGIDYNQVTVKQSPYDSSDNYGRDLIIQYGTSQSDYIVLKGWFTNNGGNIEKIAFDGVVYDKTISDLVKESGYYNGTSGVDHIFGNYPNTEINAYAGNDYIYLCGKDVTVNAGEGDDTICIEAPNGKFADSGSANITGGPGNDNCRFYSDTACVFNYTIGDGGDTIETTINIDGDGSRSTLNFMDVDFSGLKFIRSSSNLKIQYGDDVNDYVLLKNWFASNRVRVNKISFNGVEYNKTITDICEEKGIINVATSGGDYFNSRTDGITISSLGGADNIYTYGNNVTVDAGAGNDNVYMYGNNTTVDGGAGNDTINLYGDGAVVTGGEGQDSVRIYGNDSNITTGVGNDYLYLLSDGAQIFNFTTGDGSDSISLNLNGNNGDGSNTVLNFTDVTIDDLTFTRSGTYLVIQYGSDPNDKVTINWWFESRGKYINKIAFNGVEYDKTLTEIISKTPGIYDCTDANEHIHVKGDNVTIDSGAGDDYIYLYGSNGNATGGLGNDVLMIRSDDLQTLNFRKGDGSDSVYLRYDGYNSDGSNVILNFADSDFSELSFSVSYTSLRINYGTNSSDYVSLNDWFGIKDRNIDTIMDKNGDTYSISETLISKNIGLISNDSTVGTSGADKIYIKEDNMGIEEYTLVGGRGNDELIINSNDSVNVIFYNGDGNDVLKANSKHNSKHTLKFEEAIVSDMTFTADGNNLKISYTENDSVTLNDWFSSDNVIDTVIDMNNTDYTEQLDQLHSDVTAWMSAHTAYADVSEALADTENADVAQLIAYFNIGA